MTSPLENRTVQGSTPLSDASSSSIAVTQHPKRSLEASQDAVTNASNRRKAAKVSRACDHCKSKKLKCTGTIPCKSCSIKGIACEFNAQYRRGRPPTPPRAVLSTEVPQRSRDSFSGNSDQIVLRSGAIHRSSGLGPASRTSPGFETAEIEGQIVGPTSNLTFIHRAWKRLALQNRDTGPNVLTGSENSQPLMSAGDKPFMNAPGQEFMPMDREASIDLFKFYFDNCAVTYRILHQQTCERWLEFVLENVERNAPVHADLGHAKAAVVVGILAIAGLRQHKFSTPLAMDAESSFALRQSEQHFTTSLNLTAGEIGLPQVESAQARVLQVLYLLQTSRMNQAWYVFGNTIPLISALGLHRKATRHRVGGSRSPTVDYISSQCCKRTFWVVYTIDKYLAVVFGRPRFYHDDDVDQDYPDRVNDEDMTPQGPSLSEPLMDCHIDALIFHARVARIIEQISREVYSLKPMSNDDRLAAAQKFTRQLHDWRLELPSYLGTVRPSSLIPSFARQAIALKLAYSHAIMHANRPFLLEYSNAAEQTALGECVAECLSAARIALTAINGMFSDGKVLFYALWWTPYVTFCALAVVYIWEIKQKASGMSETEDPSLFGLAEQCQVHLATALGPESASRRYSLIIEELRLEAKYNSSQNLGRQNMPSQLQQDSEMLENSGATETLGSATDNLASIFEDQVETSLNPLSQWQATDWLDLDSSAFGIFPELEISLSL
ncbi:fungal-specific transcription factor domain-containing protein [Thelonectria olida]|uniref:Fungal-specific transcription factor domain-containing protein n=1 Tax=Thelonectria olida TaxID=1576542 RepID=A0A9P8VUW6_9HYPO|nr:fungal-specific transcription factor domain-containing protein [Thelonectria olida]